LPQQTENGKQKKMKSREIHGPSPQFRGFPIFSSSSGPTTTSRSNAWLAVHTHIYKCMYIPNPLFADAVP